MSRRADVRTAPPITAPRTGLLASVPVVDREGSTRWGAGLDWQPELHGPDSGGYPFGARSIDCDPGSLYFGEDEKSYVSAADPFVVYAFDWCSAMDSRFAAGRDWQGRARRLLEATQSASIAQELWYGTIIAADAQADGPWLTDGNETDAANGNGPYQPQYALAVLDQYATIRMSNGRAAIHCSAHVLSMLATAGAIRREGGLWLTPTDNIVIADAGYGAATRGIQNVPSMYATPIPTVVLGPVDVTPLDQRALYTSVNDVLVVAQRDVLVMWDSSVLHGYVELNLDECPCNEPIVQ